MITEINTDLETYSGRVREINKDSEKRFMEHIQYSATNYVI